MQNQSTSAATTDQDPELERIVREEQRCLEKVLSHLEERSKAVPAAPPSTIDYDAELLSLRDQIATARMEDVPPLLEQMERMQSLAARKREQSEVAIDGKSPYFGRLVLKEGPKTREVLIGRGTYLDTRAGVRIVDWRDAPVSRLYYRYDEGDGYDEVFGEREISGEVLTRRSVGIMDRELRRIGAPQGNFARGPKGNWRRLDHGSAQLRGGAGSATRVEEHHRPGKLGVKGGDDREDKHLKEITALIDPRQFELITRSDSGLVVIQGGAGSGKTTIGLHRLAYLAYADKRRFRADRMLVMVFNDALARYVSLVLPALDVPGVPIKTYAAWASRLRTTHVLRLPRRYHEDTPPEVTKLKKSPAMLTAIDAHVARFEASLGEKVAAAAMRDGGPAGEALLTAWRKTEKRPSAHRLHALSTWLGSDGGKGLNVTARLNVEGLVERGLKEAKDVAAHWAELLGDKQKLWEVFGAHPRGNLTQQEFDRAHAWSAKNCVEVLHEFDRKLEEAQERQEEREQMKSGSERGGSGDDDAVKTSDDLVEAPRSETPKPARRDDDRDDEDRDDGRDEDGPSAGIDGRELDEGAKLDPEDDTLLLRLVQRLRGPLVKTVKGSKQKEALQYEHILVDEAQDMSPVELAVVLETTGPQKSVTLAGDVAQRLHMDNGFSDWQSLLGDLGMSHVEIEPLKLSYRSTAEIVEFSRAVLGPLAEQEAPVATRHGAPVEMMSFGHTGDAVAFLAEALRDLMMAEPNASVCVISRYAEHADLYFEGLKKGEVPYLRRVADQDFTFKPGVDVTDIRQVKGLEFDYVVLVEVNASAYPPSNDARHLLHIGGTRGAHQLWILATGQPSSLLPRELVDRSL